MNLRKISSSALLENTSRLAAEERRIGLEILHHFRELDRRRLFAERGYSSLFEMAVKEFAYSEAAAGRRIAAMRLLRELPVLEVAVQDGRLNLSTAAQLQQFLKAETKSGKVYSGSEKLELAQKMMGKSRRDCEKVLVVIAPASVRRQSSHVVSECETELKVVLKDATLEKLKRIKDLLAHKYPHADYATLIDHMADLTLEKIDPEKKASRAEMRNVARKADVNLQQQAVAKNQAADTDTAHSAGGVASRYIPAAIKRKVYARDRGCCTYIDSITKRKCNSRYLLEFDHVIPIALDGKTEVNNLRMRCHSHNQLAAIQIYGEEKMSEFVPWL